jgi:hypothetical protein
MEYKYIRAWGMIMGSFIDFIESEIYKAQCEKTPQTAICRRQDGTWATVEGIRSEDTKNRIERYVAAMC